MIRTSLYGFTDGGVEKGQGMQSQESERGAGREPFLDATFHAVACVAILLATFSVLIMGFFVTNSETSTVLIIGTGVILCGPAVLLLMILAKLASRRVSSRSQTQQRTAMMVSAIVYCFGAAALAFGTWRGMRLWLPAPIYQEAGLEAHNSIPQF